MQDSGIFIFPLAESRELRSPWPEGGLCARRIPDLLCTYLGSAEEEAALVEIRAADESGAPIGRWARLREEPRPEDARAFLDGQGARVFITGTLRQHASDLEVTFHLIPMEGFAEGVEITGMIEAADPVRGFLTLARRVAAALEADILHESFASLCGTDPKAFLQVLLGFEGAASLDPEILGESDPVSRLRPLLAALETDGGQGLALRRLNQAIHEGIASSILTVDQGLRLLDEALERNPRDSTAMTAIGDFLAAIDEEERAEGWLTAAAALEDAPAPCLESLGILLANRGETVQARNLWLMAVDKDGHPDFFAHLARLAFLEKNYDEAWDKTIRGLRRLNERRLHPGEWGGEEAGRSGVLLRYLAEHLAEIDDPRVIPPRDLAELCLDLVGQIEEPSDRLDLGLCLVRVGEIDIGVSILRSVLPHVEDPDRAEEGWEVLGKLTIEGFAARMRSAPGETLGGESRGEALSWWEEAAKALPRFGRIHLRLGSERLLAGRTVEAREAYEIAAFLLRDETGPLRGLAAASLRSGALDESELALRRALEIEPEDAGLHADLALLLHGLGREEEAAEALEIAEVLDPGHPSVAQARDRLG